MIHSKFVGIASSGAKSINYLKNEQNQVNVYAVYATDCGQGTA